MASLYITSAQPNPPGRDATRGGFTSNAKLNEEWLEFAVVADRNMTGDVLSHLTFTEFCRRTGADVLYRFGSLQLRAGHRVRVHTGVGTAAWNGDTLHLYAGRSWFVWNNACGDRATLSYDGKEIDSAYYDSNPPEGVLVRQQGTDRLIPARTTALRW